MLDRVAGDPYLGFEDGKGAERLHGFGGVGDGPVEEADHRRELAPVQGVADEHHPLAAELLQHEGRVEPEILGEKLMEFDRNSRDWSSTKSINLENDRQTERESR